MRKKLTILLLMVAQVLIFGHGFVPHHHHTDSTGSHHHYHNDDQDIRTEHSEENPLQVAFSEFMHSGEQVIFTQPDYAKTVVTKRTLWGAMGDLACDFANPAQYIISYQKHTFPPDRCIRYQPFLYESYSLRGPPFIV